MNDVDTNPVSRAFAIYREHLLDGGDGDRPQAPCLSHATLIRCARRRVDELDSASHAHLKQCPRCTALSVAYRVRFAALKQPETSRVALRIQDPRTEDGLLQVLGFVSVETREFRECRDSEEWNRHPLFLRVNLLIDTACDVLALTVLDPFPTLSAVRLHTPIVPVPLAWNAHDRVFEMQTCISTLCGGDKGTSDAVVAWVRNGGLVLEFTARKPTVEEVRASWADPLRALLHEANVLEREFEYQLPSGCLTDTFVNLEKLSDAEGVIDVVVDALDDTFGDIAFDTILAHGWAMGTFARRLAWRRKRAGAKRAVRCVMSEGYASLTFTGDIEPHSRVLVLSDINVKGKLLDRLVEHVHQAPATPVCVGAFVQARGQDYPSHVNLRPLCEVEMVIRERSVEHSMPNLRQRRVFNPISCCMTELATDAQSVAEFLQNNENALDLWTLLNRSGAYMHHRRDGDTHYIAYVDMMKLLGHTECGPEVAGRLCAELVNAEIWPDVILVPNRKRSLLLAELLLKACGAHGHTAAVHTAGKHLEGGENTALQVGPWRAAPGAITQFAGRKVLVVDTAIGHGDTIDCLVQIARAAGAANVGAATVLSRLTEGCEAAFDARLSMGFVRLFNLPIRPVLISGHDASLCPVCQRKAAIERVGKETGSEAIKKLAERIMHPQMGRRTTSDSSVAVAARQMFLFSPSSELLRTCKSSIASGVTLHALSASRNGGMAPLALPEIADTTIPARNRTAMLENLPQAAIEWCGDGLKSDARQFIRQGKDSNVWRAAAELLARSGSSEWVHHIPDLLKRVKNRKRLSASFFSHLAVAGYIATHNNSEVRRRVRDEVRQISKGSLRRVERKGVRCMVKALPV